MRFSRTHSDEAILSELGSRLAALRLAHNLTQAALAQEAGVSKRTIERLERGEVGTRLPVLVRVLRELDLVEKLDALVPPAFPGPIELLQTGGRGRRRASRPRKPTAAKAGR